jgi:cleavage and polyadenylation specificity factor subunit 1
VEGIAIRNRTPGMTVSAGAFFGGTAILHVLNNAIRVLEPGTRTLLYQAGWWD